MLLQPTLIDIIVPASIAKFVTHSVPLNTSWMDWNCSNSLTTNLIFMSPQDHQNELVWLSIMKNCPWVTFDDWQWGELMWNNGINLTVWFNMNGVFLPNGVCLPNGDELNAQNWPGFEFFWWQHWTRMREWTLEFFQISMINTNNGFNSTGQLNSGLANLLNASQSSLEISTLTSEFSSVLSSSDEGSLRLPWENLGEGRSHWPVLEDDNRENLRWQVLEDENSHWGLSSE